MGDGFPAAKTGIHFLEEAGVIELRAESARFRSYTLTAKGKENIRTGVELDVAGARAIYNLHTPGVELMNRRGWANSRG